VQNSFIAFFLKHALQSSFKYLYLEWTFAERMGSQHFSNPKNAFRAFKNKLRTRNLKACVVKSVPTYFTNVKWILFEPASVQQFCPYRGYV